MINLKSSCEKINWASTLMTRIDVHSEHLMLLKTESPAVDSHMSESWLMTRTSWGRSPKVWSSCLIRVNEKKKKTKKWKPWKLDNVQRDLPRHTDVIMISAISRKWIASPLDRLSRASVNGSLHDVLSSLGFLRKRVSTSIRGEVGVVKKE